MSILFIGGNKYIDDIVRNFLLRDGEGRMIALGDKSGLPFANKVVITTTNNLDIRVPITDKPTVIFTTDFNEGVWVEGEFPKNLKIYQFFTPYEMCEMVLENNVVFKEDVPLCDLSIFLRGKSVENLFAPEEGDSIIFPKTSVFPPYEVIERYFKKKPLRLSAYGVPPMSAKGLNPPLLFTVPKKVSVFIPTYYRLEKAKACVESLLASAHHSQNEYTFYIGDNNTQDDKMQEWLRSLKAPIDKLGKDTCRVEVYHSEKNIGKSGIVNEMYRKYVNEEKPDYIFSIDSDMVLPESLVIPPGEETLPSLDGMIDVLDRCRNVGIVSSQQTGECHHWFGRSVEVKTELGYHIGESKTGIGISGGCVVMRCDDWEIIGGYAENYDVYTADDAILMDKVEKVLGKRAVVAMDYPLFHPPVSPEDVDEKGYKEWKMKRFQNDGLKFDKREEGHRGTDVGYFEGLKE